MPNSSTQNDHLDLNTTARQGGPAYSHLTTGRAPYGLSGMLQAAFAQALQSVILTLLKSKKQEQATIQLILLKLRQFFKGLQDEASERSQALADLALTTEQEAAMQAVMDEAANQSGWTFPRELMIDLKNTAASAPIVMSVHELQAHFEAAIQTFRQAVQPLLADLGLNEAAQADFMQDVRNAAEEQIVQAFDGIQGRVPQPLVATADIQLKVDIDALIAKRQAQAVQTPLPQQNDFSTIHSDMMMGMFRALDARTSMRLSAFGQQRRERLLDVFHDHAQNVMRLAQFARALGVDVRQPSAYDFQTQPGRDYNTEAFPGQQRYLDEQARTARENAHYAANRPSLAEQLLQQAGRAEPKPRGKS